MTFAHDTASSLQSTAALVNTAPSQVSEDLLSSVDELETFVAEWEYTGSRGHDQRELDAVRSLRARLRRLWEVDLTTLVALVNELLAEHQALPQLVDHDGWGWHLHAIASEAPLADRMAVEAAMAFVDVIRSGETDRLRTCAAEDCDGVIVDLSKNRSRRYCDRGCGNRMAVQAYRARRS